MNLFLTKLNKPTQGNLPNWAMSLLSFISLDNLLDKKTCNLHLAHK